MSLKLRNFKDILVEAGGDHNWAQGGITAPNDWNNSGSSQQIIKTDGTSSTGWWATPPFECEMAFLLALSDINPAIDAGESIQTLYNNRINIGLEPGATRVPMSVDENSGLLKGMYVVASKVLGFSDRIGQHMIATVSTGGTTGAVHQANTTWVFRSVGRTISNLPEAGIEAWT